jgi:hypothetical protein
MSGAHVLVWSRECIAGINTASWAMAATDTLTSISHDGAQGRRQMLYNILTPKNAITVRRCVRARLRFQSLGVNRKAMTASETMLKMVIGNQTAPWPKHRSGE